MSLAAGARLGPYQVVSPLGAGGMGEVYRATDARLGREVAVKVLPDAWARDEARLRRFEHEARTAGTLNHPNLLTILDVGIYDGSPYIVSELLEGSTLRSVLEGEALPLRKALDYAVQIASGLAAAHEKGIVHRDLKPENLFLTRDGRAKILDFGLAKLTRPSGSRAEESDAPTATSPTSPGTVMGTVGYMSPEQVQGLSADHRSDIFSLGAVLFEMLWGKRAFKGATAVETMNAILKEDPPEVSDAARAVPPALERIVRRCLEKKPQERFHSAHDLALALEALSGASSGLQGAPTARTPRLRAAWAVAVAAALVAAWVGFRYGAAARVINPPSFTKLTFQRGYVGAARFSPDGQTIVYSAAWDGQPMEIFSTRPDAVESRALGLPGTNLLAISSQAEMAVGLDWHQDYPNEGWGVLACVGLAGGAPRELMRQIRLAEWSADGKSLAIVRQEKGTYGKYRLEFPPGRPLYDTTATISGLRLSPAGGRVGLIEAQNDEFYVRILEASGKTLARTRAWHRAQGLAWGKGGEELWFTAAEKGITQALYALDLAGEVRLVARFPASVMLHDVSADGRLLLSANQTRRETVVKPPGSAPERDLTWLGYSWPSDLSSDGRKLLLSITESESATAIYLRGTDGSAAVRLGEGLIGSRLSPDGNWVLAVLSSTQPGALRYELVPTGPGEVQSVKIAGIDSAGGEVAWFPDGKRVVFWKGGGGGRLYTTEVPVGTARPVAPEGMHDAFAVSPSGREVLAFSQDGRAALFPVGGGAPRWVPGSLDDDLPLWVRPSSDPRRVFLMFGSPWTSRPRIERLDLATGKRELWKEIHPADPAGVLNVYPVVITPDGQSYAYTLLRTLSTLHLVQDLR